jgi:integrase
VVFLPGRYWKNGEPQSMPLVGELAEIIARRRAARAVTTKDGVMLSAFIFHRDGKPIGDMRKSWKAACKLAGMPGRLFHDLCRTFARDADNAGVSRSVAKDVMGRKTEAIYARYRIVAEHEKASALLRMQQKSLAKPELNRAAATSRPVEHGQFTDKWIKNEGEPINRLPFNLHVFYEFFGCGGWI